MIIIGKGQSNHVNQGQEGEEQDSDERDGHKGHVETTVDQGFHILHKTRSRFALFFEEMKMAGAFKVAPIEIGKKETKDQGGQSKDEEQHGIVPFNSDLDLDAINFLSLHALGFSAQGNQPTKGRDNLANKGDNKENFTEEEEATFDQLPIGQIGKAH